MNSDELSTFPVVSQARIISKRFGSSSRRVTTWGLPDCHNFRQAVLKNLDCLQMSYSLMNNSSALGPTMILRGSEKLCLCFVSGDLWDEWSSKPGYLASVGQTCGITQDSFGHFETFQWVSLDARSSSVGEGSLAAF